jgi:serpin B
VGGSIACGAALVGVLGGCSAKTTTPPAVCSAPQGSPSAARQLASVDTAFAVAFYPPAAGAAGAGGNVIVSPYSVSATLTMVDTGAAGETDAQIQATLHLPGNGGTLAPAFAALACTDETDGTIDGQQLSIANAVWAQQGKTFEVSFLSTLSKGYGAPLQQADFAGDPSGAASAIDAWVSQQTQGQIQALLQGGDVDDLTRIILVDAVYFRGTWDQGFNPSATAPANFTLSDGTLESVPTMNGLVNLGVSEGQALSVYELPYKGGGLAMDFVLPAGQTSFASLVSSLTLASLSAGIGSLSSEQVQLSVPKFAFQTRLELAPLLGAMGMPDLFDPTNANLSGIDGMTDLYVSDVVQQATVEVDESGTVATAATSVQGGESSGFSEGPDIVRIDVPFLFLIRDTNTGSILFMGQVQDPLQG